MSELIKVLYTSFDANTQRAIDLNGQFSKIPAMAFMQILPFLIFCSILIFIFYYVCGKKLNNPIKGFSFGMEWEDFISTFPRNEMMGLARKELAHGTLMFMFMLVCWGIICTGQYRELDNTYSSYKLATVVLDDEETYKDVMRIADTDNMVDGEPIKLPVAIVLTYTNSVTELFILWRVFWVMLYSYAIHMFFQLIIYLYMKNAMYNKFKYLL